MKKTALWSATLLTLALIAPGLALAKKPPKPPPPPPTDPDPAIAYTAVTYKGTRATYTPHVMNADGSNKTEVPLPDSLGRVQLHKDWSPDRTQLVFLANEGGELGIYVVNVDGTGLRRVVELYNAPLNQMGAAPVWSPGPVPGIGSNQSWIAYAERVPGMDSADLFMVSLDGTQKVRVTDTPKLEESSPTWSPDATRIAFKNGDRDRDSGTPARMDLWGIYDFTTGLYDARAHQGPLAGANSSAPSWAKTQDKIVFSVYVDNENNDLWVEDLDDPANPYQLTNTPDMIERAADWSEDDSQIVFQNRYWHGGWKYDVDVIDANGANRERLVKGGLAPAWRR